MIDAQWQAARNVLTVRLDNLGDVLVTTPAMHALKASLPEARLTLLASPVGAQVGRLNPDVDDVIVYQAPWMDPWRRLPQDSAREQQMIATIKERRFDAAVIFTSFRQSPLPSAYLCYLADIPLRAAASVDGPGSLLTMRHKHPERMMHEVERGLDLVSAIGCAVPTEPTDPALDLVLAVPAEARAALPALLSCAQRERRIARTAAGARASGPSRSTAGGTGETPALPIDGLFPAQRLAAQAEREPQAHYTRMDRSRGPLVVVHPGCSMPARTYPWEMYAAVVDGLVARLGATVALTGADDERELVERVYGRLRPEARRSTLRLAGALPFPVFCALIEAADVSVTNNTGPMHISAAVKTPVVALFALTNPPEQWGPWRVPHRQLYHDVPCRICYSRICPFEHECLRQVAPHSVVDAVVELLDEPSATSRQPSADTYQPLVTASASASVMAGATDGGES